MLFFFIVAWFQCAETTNSQSKHYCYFIPQNLCVFIQIFADCLFWDCKILEHELHHQSLSQEKQD